MRICLITGIFPPDIGGPATYVSRLASSLHQKRYTVCVVTLGKKRSEHPFVVKPVSRSLALSVRLVVLFGVLVRYGWRSDVWYINGLELPAVFAGKLLRKRMVMKIVGDHAWERAMNFGRTSDSIDDFQQKKQQHWKVELHKHLRAWLARQVDQIITPSHYLKKLVCGWGVPQERIQVIYNAVEELPDKLEEKDSVREQFGAARNDKLLITVGRLVPWKGIDQLIHTMSLLDQSFKLMIVGDGPEKNSLTDLVANLELSRRIRFLGKAQRKQVLSYMAASDLFVLNTRYEGFSHVLLEALMVGIPVITTSVGGNPELIRHEQNGFLIPPEASGELVHQINRVMNNIPLQKRVVAEGKNSVSKYSWERLLQETIEILRGN